MVSVNRTTTVPVYYRTPYNLTLAYEASTSCKQTHQSTPHAGNIHLGQYSMMPKRTILLNEELVAAIFTIEFFCGNFYRV